MIQHFKKLHPELDLKHLQAILQPPEAAFESLQSKAGNQLPTIGLSLKASPYLWLFMAYGRVFYCLVMVYVEIKLCLKVAVGVT